MSLLNCWPRRLSLGNIFFTFLNQITYFSATLLYFGTGEVGTAKGFRGLFPYTEENKAKYGLVATTKKVLKKAFEEADEEMKIKQ